MMKRNITGLVCVLLVAGCDGAPSNPASTPVAGNVSQQCGCTSIFCDMSCCINCAVSLIKQVDNAQKSVHIATNSALPPNVVDALQKAQARGVDVRVVVADSQAVVAPSLAREGIETKTYAKPFDNSVIIDGTPVRIVTATPGVVMPAAGTLKGLNWQKLWDGAQQ